MIDSTASIRRRLDTNDRDLDRVRDEITAAVHEATPKLSRVEQVKRFTIIDRRGSPGPMSSMWA